MTPWLSPPGDTTNTIPPFAAHPPLPDPALRPADTAPFSPLAPPPHSTLLHPCCCSWLVWGALVPATGCIQGSPHGQSFPLLPQISYGHHGFPIVATLSHSAQAVGQDCSDQGEKTFINMCLCLSLHGHCTTPCFLLRSTDKSKSERTKHLLGASDLCLGAAGTQGWERVSDPRQLHGTEVAKNPIIPLGRSAPGGEKRREEKRQKGVSGQETSWK